MFHRTWAILYVTQYYFISPRVLGYHHSFAFQAILLLIVLLRRLMIIVLYRTYSWQPSKFNNGFNSYTRINHLWHILPYIASLQRNTLPLQYSDILKARSNTPVKVFHYLPLDSCRETSSRTTNQATQILLFRENM